MIRMPVFGSSVSTGTASLPKWRRRSRERFNRSRSVSRRWKMCSFTAPDTDSGPRADRAKNSDGNSYVNSSQDGSSSIGWHSSARVYALVARDRTVLSPARAGGWRNRLSAAVLGCDRLGLRNFISLRPGRRTAALTRLFLSRRADHDRAIHVDLHHDVGDRRPQRGIP